ncbi:MAG: aminotransferase class IV [Proteobacteria bacterium]|nr:aminotransferase class IV [Pseudomonadota bacterium]
MKLSLNGELTEAAEARIAPDDRGFTLGDGLFETIAIKNAAPKRLAAHLARLRDGAAVLGIPVPYTDQKIAELAAGLIGANELTAGALRITLTRGPGARGIAPPEAPTPTFMITSGALPPDDPLRLIVAQGTRRNEQSPLARVKNLGYLDNIIARREAVAAGADDAVLLNTQGRVAETTIANIFCLIGGGLVTPPVCEGALPGVMRAEVIRLARAEERPIEVGELAHASEIFVSNALGIRPVLHMNGQEVGDGAPGLITQLLAVRL